MLNPINPPNNQILQDDYMLDALERSIEKTIVPPDLLMVNPNFLIDDVGRQLDRVEARIENMPLIPSDISIIDNSTIPMQAHDMFELELPSANINTQLQTPKNNSMSDSQNSPAKPPQQNESRTGRHIQPFKGYKPLSGGRTNAQSSIGLRHCSENNELIDREICESCKKYRHWPDGTDEEPRECWHDWQLTQFYNKDETEDGNELL
ncbi:MAG: hypothetical protein ABR969_00910 [Sedimentisphaerales bacterium]|jgi:hypothetical protein